MKALKEKRVSLRTFLRRGLVILSLFALAFASCSDSSGGAVTPTDPTSGTNPPPAGPTIKSLTILTQPTKESYQGYPPVLTDLAVEIEWSNGTREYAYYNDNPSAFATVPGVCEYAFPNPALPAGTPNTYGQGTALYGLAEGSTLQLVYKGQPAPVNVPVRVPMVVGASKIEITQNKKVDWYSDTRADFDGLVYNVIFDTGWLGLGKNSVADVFNPYLKLENTMNAAFPKVDYKDAMKDKKITVFGGPTINAGGMVTPPTAVRGGNASAYAMPRNRVETDFMVNYYGVAAVRLVDANWQVYFDDDLDMFYTNNKIDPEKVFDALKKSNVKFEVSYDHSDRKETITTDQYIANNNWYYNLSVSGGAYGVTSVTLLNDLVVTNDDITWPRSNMTRAGLATSSLTQGKTSVLWYGKDEDNEESWRVTLNYIPWNFTNSADYTQVDVPIPLYLFEELQVVNKAPGATNLRVGGRDLSSGVQLDNEELRAIANRWDLVGVYTSGRNTATRVIPLTHSVIYAGFYGHSVELSGSQSGWAGLDGRTGGFAGYPTGANISIPGTTPVNVWWPNVSAIGYKSVGTPQNNIGLAMGEIRKDFVLPLYYRGQKLTDEESILIDLIKNK